MNATAISPGILILVVAIVGVVAMLVAATLRVRQPTAAGANRTAGVASSKPSPAGDAEIARLRQNLRVKVLYDEAKVDRLVAYERQRTPHATELQYYQFAIDRWERDNR